MSPSASLVCPYAKKPLAEMRPEDCPKMGSLCVPGQVFISYSHQDGRKFIDDLLRRLVRFKKTPDKKIWVDKTHIEGGRMWDVCLEQAIRLASMVIPVLTEGSLQNESICRDEVAWAIRERKKVVPIRTSRDVGTSLLLVRRSFVDFSDDFTEGIKSLLALLEDGDELLRPPLFHSFLAEHPIDFSAEIADYLEDFTEREWLWRELRKKTGRQILAITGGPGAGKTVFAAWLATRKHDVIASHFFSGSRDETLEPSRFLGSIVSQIGSTLVRLAPSMKNRGEKWRSYDFGKPGETGDALRHFLIDPLNEIARPPTRTRYIVIDSLDEAFDHEESRMIVDLLGKTAHLFPKWLKIIVTLRPQNDVLDRLSKVSILDLAEHRKKSIRDVSKYVRERLEKPPLRQKIREKEAVAESLIDLADGNFLYASSVLDALSEGELQRSELGKLTHQLHSLYATLFQVRFPDLDEFDARFGPLLSVLAASRTPRTAAQLDRICGACGTPIGRRLKRLQTFLLERKHPDSGRRVYSLYHKSLSDWLVESGGPPSDYACRQVVGHELIAKELARTWRDDRFAPEHLLFHLRKAHMWDELEEVLADIEFLSEKQKEPQKQYKLQREFRRLLCDTGLKPRRLETLFRRILGSVRSMDLGREKADWLDTFAYWIHSTDCEDDARRDLLRTIAIEFDCCCAEVSKQLSEDFLRKHDVNWALRYAELRAWTRQRAGDHREWVEACREAERICSQKGIDKAYATLGRIEFLRLRVQALDKVAEEADSEEEKSQLQGEARKTYRELNDRFAAAGPLDWRLQKREWKKFENNATWSLYPPSCRRNGADRRFNARIISNKHDSVSAMHLIRFLESEGGAVEWVHHEQFSPADLAPEDTLFTILIGGPKAPGISGVADRFYVADEKRFLRMFSGLFCEAVRLEILRGDTHCYMLGGISRINTLKAAHDLAEGPEIRRILQKARGAV